MTTQFFQRPTAGYTGEAGLPNRTKYNDDSTASPRRPISSAKVDGDINYLIDAVNALYDTAVSGVVADGSITNAKLRDSAACSVIGRSVNTSGVPTDITAVSNDTVLVRKSNTVSFSTVPTAGIEDAAITSVKIADTNVTFVKIQNVNTATVLGRSSSGAGSVEALTLGNGLNLTGGVLSGATATDSVAGVVELATSSEVQTGTDTTRAITPAGFSASSLGYGQTYQNVLASRAYATNYTNNTGRPIQVFVSNTASGSAATLTATVGGVTFTIARCALPSGAAQVLGSFIVPNGVVYQVNQTGSGASPNEWFELR